MSSDRASVGIIGRVLVTHEFPFPEPEKRNLRLAVSSLLKPANVQ